MAENTISKSALHEPGSPEEQLPLKAGSNVIRKTMDYSIFKRLEGNRPLNEKHVEELVERMQEHDFHEDAPISVTPELVVIDGQHRLEARARLSRPVYYKVSKAMRPEDVATVNSTAQNWQLRDYLEYHIVKGNQDYIRLKEFAERWNILPYNAIGLLSGNSAQPSGQDIKNFERGGFIVKDEAFANSVMERITDFEPVTAFYKAKAFLNAFVRVSRLPAYDHVEMVRQAKLYPDLFGTKYNDVRSWLNSFETAFNKRKPAGQAVNFRVA